MTELDKIMEKLPSGEYLGYWDENGDYEIIKRSDLVSNLSTLVEQSSYCKIEEIVMNNWSGFKTHKKIRLHLLNCMRCWRDEIAGSVDDLRRLKQHD